MIDIAEKVQAFEPMFQDLNNLFDLLEKNEISMGAFRSFIRGERRRHERENAKVFEMRKEIEELLTCPDCGAPLRLMPVNISPGDQVDKRYHSVLTCTDWKECGYERYSRNAPNEELGELKRRRINGTR